jgi:hypothetical protein
MSHIVAPWTQDEITALNRWQNLGYVHPFTCPTNHLAARILEARKDGWHCPSCDYTQNWAHDFMLTRPENPLERTAEQRHALPEQ